MEFIESEKWRFASSMPSSPHWYIVKDKVDQEKFLELGLHIRENGRLGIWHNMYLDWYLQFRDHAFYYWSLGSTMDLTEIPVINRARLETDDVHYLDNQRKLSSRQRSVLDNWCEQRECPYCRSHDPFAQQWAGEILIGLFCSSCRRRFL